MEDSIKSMDAVEVVRCKDCKFYEPELDWWKCSWCKAHDHETLDDDFCSRGEKINKEEE